VPRPYLVHLVSIVGYGGAEFSQFERIHADRKLFARIKLHRLEKYFLLYFS
jgi:hypothetical protein